MVHWASLRHTKSEIVVPGDDEGLPVRQFVIVQQMDLLVMDAFVHSRLR
jgi:hypothetical protein